ncbi:MAG: hypothetical protein RIR00_1973, partial [Pseudomonadota bacterium]
PLAERQSGELLLAHAQQILSNNLKVRSLINSLVGHPFTSQIEEAYRSYGQQLSRHAQRADLYRLLLTLVSLLLIAAVVRILLRLRKAATELRRNHQLLDKIADNLGEGILSFDADGRLNFLNLRAETLLGRPAAGLLGKKLCQVLFHSDEPTDSPLCHALRHHQAFDGETWITRSDGSKFPAAFLGAPLPADEGSAGGFVTSFRDLSEIRQAEARLHLAGRVFNHLSEALTITDNQGHIQSVNAAFETITGYSEAEALGHTPGELLASGQHDESFYHAMWEALAATGTWQGEIFNRRKNGEIYPEWLSISAVREPGGEIVQYIGLFSDITERKESEAYIHHLAYHDPLTGLANRLLFSDRLETAIRQAHRNQRQLAVLLLDLDRFKSINDTLGHSAGDLLIKEVARRLEQSLGEGDTLARLGGDEFALLIPEIHSAADADLAAVRLLGLFDECIALNEREIFASTSIGIALYPKDGGTAEVLLKNADLALYSAKDAGRAVYRFFVSNDDAGSIARLDMESALRLALGRKQFYLHYQMQMDVQCKGIVGVEALLRWHHPQLGQVPPERFIPMAESLGLIDAIGAWCLETACRQWVTWERQGLFMPRVAVNVSSRQLRQPDFVATVLDIIRRTGIPPAALELELTESMLSEDTERTFEIFATLRSHSIQIAIDDFGTGYSSLSYLARYPVDVVKIDRSFVTGIEQDPEARSIVQAIILLAHGLNMTTIAEGVETEGQRAQLEALGCDELQGYLFARPCAPDPKSFVVPNLNRGESTLH